MPPALPFGLAVLARSGVGAFMGRPQAKRSERGAAGRGSGAARKAADGAGGAGRGCCCGGWPGWCSVLRLPADIEGLQPHALRREIGKQPRRFGGDQRGGVRGGIEAQPQIDGPP